MTATNNIVKPCRVKDFIPTPKMDKGEAQRCYRETSTKLSTLWLKDDYDSDEADRLLSLKKFYWTQINPHNK
jgi:hypothetical protein